MLLCCINTLCTEQPVLSVNGIVFDGTNDDIVEFEAVEDVTSVTLNVTVAGGQNETANVSTTNATDGKHNAIILQIVL